MLIEQINLQGCRQSGTGPLAGSRLGESLQLEYFSPDAAVDVTLRGGLPRLQLTSGILLDWGDAEIKAQMTADFRTADGESFVLEGDVSKDWIVDTVESTPSDAMDDWSLDDSGVPAKLKITLAKAILPNRPVRIRVAARRLYSHLGPKRHLGQKLGVEDLLPLHFVARGGSEQLVAIDVPGNCHLNITAAELLRRLDPGSLTCPAAGVVSRAAAANGVPREPGRRRGADFAGTAVARLLRPRSVPKPPWPATRSRNPTLCAACRSRRPSIG